MEGQEVNTKPKVEFSLVTEKIHNLTFTIKESKFLSPEEKKNFIKRIISIDSISSLSILQKEINEKLDGFKRICKDKGLEL